MICNELGDAAFGFFLSALEGTDDDVVQAREQSIDSSIFVTYHEMGHALDDIRDISIGGNFESVADAIGVCYRFRQDSQWRPSMVVCFF